jgi:hypothetical protein
VLKAKNFAENERHNREMEQVAIGNRLDDKTGGFLPLLPLVPLVGALATGITALSKGGEINNIPEMVKQGNGLNEFFGGLLPLLPLVGAITAGITALSKADETHKNILEQIK